MIKSRNKAKRGHLTELRSVAGRTSVVRKEREEKVKMAADGRRGEGFYLFEKGNRKRNVWRFGTRCKGGPSKNADAMGLVENLDRRAQKGEPRGKRSV